jgi:hypothetical protein
MKWLVGMLGGLILLAFWWQQAETAEPLHLEGDDLAANAAAPVEGLTAVKQRDGEGEDAALVERRAVETTESAGRTTWWLRGEVVAGNNKPVAGARLIFGGEIVGQPSGQAGGLLVDISDHFRHAQTVVDKLDLRVKHPEFLDAVLSLSIPSDVRSVSVSHGARLEIPFQAVLTSVKFVVVGEVRPPAGVDVVDVDIVLFEEQAGLMQDRARPGKDGRFRLKARTPIDQTLVFFSEERRFCVKTMRFGLDGAVTDVGSVELEVGEVLHARMQWPDGRPAPGSYFANVPAPSSGRFTELPVLLEIAGTDIEYRWHRGDTDDDGAFSVSGISAGKTLRLNGDPHGPARTSVQIGRRPIRVDVALPSEPVVLEVDQTLVWVEFVDGEEPVPDVMVRTLEPIEGWRSQQTGPDGRIVIWNREVLQTIKCSASGYEERVLAPAELVEESEGSNRIELSPGIPRANLTLVLSGDEARTAEAFTLRQWRIEAGRRVLLGVEHLVPRMESRFVMEGFEPGSYEFELQVQPINGSSQFSSNVMLALVRVELAPGADVEQEVPLVEGGRLAFRAEENSSLPLQGARLRLVTPAGEEQEVDLERPRYGLHRNELVRLTCPLPAGRYVAVLTRSDGREESDIVTLVAGENTLFGED